MHDELVCDRRFRRFKVKDDVNRAALAIEIDLTIQAQRAVRELDRIEENRGYPLKMRMDNGLELISLALHNGLKTHGVRLEFIKPGKPTLNAFIGCFTF
ncbi:transposase [Yersinia entomophaga]|uniref:Transposase n=1 Tax=Yersinia entomophaga TaxID=935293 RepID=A0ABM6BKN6_YERET|nr:transposase [Yersinia entomophaga]